MRDALAVDTVAILLYEEESQQLVARAAKGIEEEVEQGVRIPNGVGFAGRIAAERVAIFIADVDHADILNPILREKGIRSLLGVPLIVEGDLIGVLHVGSLRPRVFGERDLAVLQVAAARAAPGIERARLFSALEQEHRVAMLLQRSLLPKRLVDVAGLPTAARYLPASDEVGGDWYDLFELPRGRLGVVIGDVVAHGLRAAALMGQLRTALHAYALEEHGPARTLELLDRFVQAMPEHAMATAAYAVLDPDTAALRIASAGHLPPVLVGHGEARVVEVPGAPPLGAFPYGTYEEREISLSSGETVVFYTDGLVERPRVGLMQSIEKFIAAVRGAASPMRSATSPSRRWSRSKEICGTTSRSSPSSTMSSPRRCGCGCRPTPGHSPSSDVLCGAGCTSSESTVGRHPRSRWRSTRRARTRSSTRTRPRRPSSMFMPQRAMTRSRSRSATRGAGARRVARTAGAVLTIIDATMDTVSIESAGNRHSCGHAQRDPAVRLADVQYANEDSAVIARLSGEIDMSNADSIRDAITDTMPNHALMLIVDLTDVDYLDSAGIQLLFQLEEDLRSRGQKLSIVIPAGSPANDTLKLAGVSRHVHTHETLDEARREQ